MDYSVVENMLLIPAQWYFSICNICVLQNVSWCMSQCHGVIASIPCDIHYDFVTLYCLLQLIVCVTASQYTTQCHNASQRMSQCHSVCSWCHRVCSGVMVWVIVCHIVTIQSKDNTYKGHNDSVDQLCWHPSQPHLLVTASVDKTIRIWDIRSMYHPAIL